MYLPDCLSSGFCAQLGGLFGHDDFLNGIKLMRLASIDDIIPLTDAAKFA
jgi:hypothetical protein